MVAISGLFPTNPRSLSEFQQAKEKMKLSQQVLRSENKEMSIRYFCLGSASNLNELNVLVEYCWKATRIKDLICPLR